MKKCSRCEKETNSCLPSDIGWLCYQCFSDHGVSKIDKKIRSHEEDDIQSEFFRVVHTVFPEIPEELLFHVPNGGSRNKYEARRLKKQGVKRGVADVILLMPSGLSGALCIEFKTEKGTQSEEQIKFEHSATKALNTYVLCRSVLQALEAINNYLQLHKSLL